MTFRERSPFIAIAISFSIVGLGLVTVPWVIVYSFTYVDWIVSLAQNCH